jgi:hypothetical protein
MRMETMRRAALILGCLLFVLSGICTNLCATPAPPNDTQHPCCPHHQPQPGDQPCSHVTPGQDSQAIAVKHFSSDGPPALLPQPRIFTAPLMALSTPAPSIITPDISPQLHFVLRL